MLTDIHLVTVLNGLQCYYFGVIWARRGFVQHMDALQERILIYVTTNFLRMKAQQSSGSTSVVDQIRSI